VTEQSKIISLFSGAGGMSLGFSQAGLKPVLGVDIDSDACQTYQENLGIEAFNLDLSQANPLLEQHISGTHHPFAIIGGPPCQGFSSAGLKPDTDERNKLIFNYLAFVERLRPKWFIFENVEGLLTYNYGKSIFDLVNEFIKIGYKVRLEKVNFAMYGLPQGRKRVVLIGNSMGLDFFLPPPTHSFNAGKHKHISALPLSPTLDEALEGLGKVVPQIHQISYYSSCDPTTPYDAQMRKGNSKDGVYLHYSAVTQSLVDMVAKLQPGQTMKDLTTDLWHESYKKRAFRRVMDGVPTEKRGGAPHGIKRLEGNLNSLTITSATTREFIHPHEDRPLTLREAARLQSFPDYYQFAGSATSIALQIGNAFPPLAANVLANHLLELDGSYGSDHGTYRSESKGALIGYHLTDALGMSPALASTDKLLSQLIAYQYSLPLGLGDL
jgi:DNA (cytosine-5)-methyltransferase 1